MTAAGGDRNLPDLKILMISKFSPSLGRWRTHPLCQTTLTCMARHRSSLWRRNCRRRSERTPMEICLWCMRWASMFYRRLHRQQRHIWWFAFCLCFGLTNFFVDYGFSCWRTLRCRNAFVLLQNFVIQFQNKLEKTKHLKVERSAVD